jgi:hypothetical protein
MPLPYPFRDPEGAEDNRHHGSPLAKAEAADGPLPFVQALRWLREDANRSFKQIADTAQGNLPKSTAHYMTTIAAEPELTRLPARPELVELFVRGCDRPETEVRAWVAQWHRIKEEMKLAKAKTVRLRPVPASEPPPPGPSAPADAELPRQAVRAEHSTGRHRLPDDSWWRRARRWIGFLSRMFMIAAALTGALLVVDKDGLFGMDGEVVQSVLLASGMGTVIGTVTAVYLMSSHRIGQARRIALQKTTAVLGGHHPARV